jgi:predicted amidohydrolase
MAFDLLLTNARLIDSEAVTDIGVQHGRFVAIAPGPVVADPAILNFRHVRADIRRRPRLERNG